MLIKNSVVLIEQIEFSIGVGEEPHCAVVSSSGWRRC